MTEREAMKTNLDSAHFNVWATLTFVKAAADVCDGTHTKVPMALLISDIERLYGERRPLSLTARGVVSVVADSGPLDTAAQFARRVLEADSDLRKETTP